MIKPKQLFVIITASVIGISGLLAQNSKSDYNLSANLKTGDYMAKTVIVKVKSQFRSICSAGKIENALFKSLYTSFGGMGLEKKFPFTKAPERLVNERGEHFADLTLIYEFSYNASVSLEKVISKFLALKLFEYV